MLLKLTPFFTIASPSVPKSFYLFDICVYYHKQQRLPFQYVV